MPALDLTPAETQCLASAGRTDILPRRNRSAMLVSAVFLALVIGTLIRGDGGKLLGVVFVIHILGVAWERYAYARTLGTYHSLVRKMAAAIPTSGTPTPPSP